MRGLFRGRSGAHLSKTSRFAQDCAPKLYWCTASGRMDAPIGRFSTVSTVAPKQAGTMTRHESLESRDTLAKTCKSPALQWARGNSGMQPILVVDAAECVRSCRGTAWLMWTANVPLMDSQRFARGQKLFPTWPPMQDDAISCIRWRHLYPQMTPS